MPAGGRLWHRAVTTQPEPDPLDALALALAEVRARLGGQPFADRRRVVSLLADRLPDAKRELRVVGSAIDEGVPVALAGVERHLVGLEMDRLASRLETSLGLRLELARGIVRAIAYALDLGPLPSVYADAVPIPAPVTSTPAWAGLSQPVQSAAPAPVTPSHPAWHAPAPPPPVAQDSIRIGSLTLPRKHVFGGMAAIVGLVVAFASMQMEGGDDPATPQRAVQEQAVPRGVGGEETDFGVAAKSELEPNVGTPTPLEIPVGKRVTTPQVQTLLTDKKAILIDVLVDNHPQTLKGAVYVPSGGAPGTVTDERQKEFVAVLDRLTKGDKARPLIFYCAGPTCWESYNAVLRAAAAGYTSLNWYRGGLAAWHASGLPFDTTPTPMSAR